jgi:hypothetical protein
LVALAMPCKPMSLALNLHFSYDQSVPGLLGPSDVAFGWPNWLAYDDRHRHVTKRSPFRNRYAVQRRCDHDSRSVSFHRGPAACGIGLQPNSCRDALTGAITKRK